MTNETDRLVETLAQRPCEDAAERCEESRGEPCPPCLARRIKHTAPAPALTDIQARVREWEPITHSAAFNIEATIIPTPRPVAPSPEAYVRAGIEAAAEEVREVGTDYTGEIETAIRALDVTVIAAGVKA